METIHLGKTIKVYAKGNGFAYKVYSGTFLEYGWPKCDSAEDAMARAKKSVEYHAAKDGTLDAE